MSLLQEDQYLTEHTFSLSDNQVFSSIYHDYFLKMLEKISMRRIETTDEGDKVIANHDIFNSLTELAKYTSAGFFNRKY